MNGRFGDLRGHATNRSLRAQMNAALAKRENPRSVLSAPTPSDCAKVNGNTAAKPPQVLQAANRPDEHKAEVFIFC